jgi:hypothetical protein
VPTVLRIGGLRVVIWPNDHRPAHVHVKGAGGEAVFNLNAIEDALAGAIAALCAEWTTIHGDH